MVSQSIVCHGERPGPTSEGSPDFTRPPRRGTVSGMDDLDLAEEAPAYLVSLRPARDEPLVHLAVSGSWDEVERLVQDIASRHYQVAFEVLPVVTVAEFRERYAACIGQRRPP